MYMKILTDNYEPIPSHYSEDMKEMVEHLLAKDQHSRPTVSEILTSDIVKEKMDLNGYKSTASSSSKGTPKKTLKKEDNTVVGKKR